MSSTTLLWNSLQKTKTRIDGIFFNLQGKVQNDRKKHISESEQLLLAKEHGLKNTPKQ